MSNKTCGECKHFYDYVDRRSPCCWSKPTDNACLEFEQKVITNGDKIIAGGMRAIAEFAKNHCQHCIYKNSDLEAVCFEVDCADGIEAWLNAPADCVKQNGDHDTQTALSKADYTESEVENV